MQYSDLHIVLVDSPDVWANLLPLTFTRPVGELRIGIDTIADKWRRMLPGVQVHCLPAVPYLQKLYPKPPEGDNVFIVASHAVPDEASIKYVKQHFSNPRIDDDEFLCLCRINHVYDLFRLNADVLAADFDAITAGAVSQPLSPTNTVIGDPSRVFVAPDATVECAVLNVKAGPIYIGPDAEVMEGAMLRGPIAVGEASVVNMGAKIYGATTLGPHCKVGGEVNNVVMQGYSNKAHDGFLGNAVVGEWCNIGAGCVASNLKNNYMPVKLWNYPAQRFLPTGLLHCGLIMGDHCKAGINTMFNTGTVLGIGVNVHQAGFPRNFVASFSDGGSFSGFDEMPIETFLDTARRVMARRNVELTPAMEEMYRAIYAGDYRDVL